MFMRAQSRTPRSPLPRIIIGVLVVALTLPWTGASPAQAADARLEKAQKSRIEVQHRLDKLVRRLSALEADVAAVEDRLAKLHAEEARATEQAADANEALALRVRESYKRGATDPMFSLLSSTSPQQAMSQARLLGLLAKRSRGDFELASATRIRTRATATSVERVARDLHAREAELAAVRSQVSKLLAEAKQREGQVRSRIAREQASKRRTARRTGRQSIGRGLPGGTAAVVNGAACPVGSPRSYSDTWGAPRSGGRRHKGTDILAPRGTGIYAYEAGAITRMTNSRVGGISIYMRGVSGNVYYYTHLQSYVSGLSSGQRVAAGQHIAFNGDTGNARGTPHLHFEVMPGGGGNTNPYPYVRRACG